MKKLLTLIAIALAVVVSSCSKFDDSAIWDKLNEQEQTLNDHEKRIAALEELCRQLNTNIDALQTIVEALEKMDYVTNVSPVREDGEIVGYTISFANSDTITIYNGKDGKDGQDGQNGYTPQIGVMKDTDGIYYWTIDGEWLLDDNGNKIKAVGEDGRDGQDGTDGANGEDGRDGQDGTDGANGNDGQDGTDGKDGITPRLKIENDYWYVSYDEGATWIELGKATGEDGADGSDGEDGDSIFSSVTQDDEYVYFNLADGTIITLPKHDDTEKPVFEIDGDGNYIVEAVGGTVVVAVTTNLEYTVKIPTEAQSWISVADTRAVREETLTFNVAKNEDSEERSATVNLCAKGGDILQTITIKQNKSNAISCANNEIIYTTKYGYPIELNITEGFGGNIMSHNFANGYGIISFDNDVVSIPNEAFNGCTTLTTIVLPNSLSTITYSAFSGCTSLTSITIPDSVTEIGSYAFRDCTSLTSITIPDSVTKIGESAFSGCTGELIVNCNISSATDSKNGVFYGADFTKVTIGDSVTSIGSYAFYGCSSLTRVDITDIEAWCKISFGHPSSNPLTNAHNLYLNGELVTDVVIPDSVTKIGGYAFYNCTSLTSITIPDSVTKIGSSAFYGCTGELIVNCNISSATDSKNRAFYGADFTKVTIGDSVTSIGDYAFYDCTSLTSITIGNGVTSIGSSAFSGCTSLTSVTIGNGVTTIGSSAFSGCSSLERVDITDIVAWCGISFGNYSSNPLTYAHNLYLNGELVTDVVIPDSVTSIGSYAFYNCTSLTSITIPESVTSIGSHAFSGCTGELIVNCNIPSYAFYGADFTKVTIGDSVTSIGSYAFYGANFTKVTIGDSVTKIGDSAFYDCTSLTSVTIGDSVTKIGWSAFEDCTSLTSITIPDSVTTIGGAAFENCTSLMEVYCKPITPPMGGNNMFYDNASGRTIYVPRDSVEAYKSASKWSAYADSIVGYVF